jgi:hypothetical protein
MYNLPQVGYKIAQAMCGVDEVAPTKLPKAMYNLPQVGYKIAQAMCGVDEVAPTKLPKAMYNLPQVGYKIELRFLCKVQSFIPIYCNHTIMSFNYNNHTFTLSFTVTIDMKGQSDMNEHDHRAICDQVQSTTMKAFSPDQYVVDPRFFGTKTFAPTSAATEENMQQAIVPFVFDNPTFHHGSTFQNVGAQAAKAAANVAPKGGRTVEPKGGRTVEPKGESLGGSAAVAKASQETVAGETTKESRRSFGRGQDLYHRVVGAIGHRKQTFTSAKHRFDANRLKNVFHSRREMQVSENRIKSYLMYALSPMEKEVLDATAEYRHIYYKSPEEIVLAHKRRTIMNRVNHQYNKLLATTFPTIKHNSNHLTTYSQ